MSITPIAELFNRNELFRYGFKVLHLVLFLTSPFSRTIQCKNSIQYSESGSLSVSLSFKDDIENDQFSIAIPIAIATPITSNY